jgi:hypothetical protein
MGSKVYCPSLECLRDVHVNAYSLTVLGRRDADQITKTKLKAGKDV